MNQRPAHDIGLEQAAPGMTLAAALLDAHGAVLLPQDAVLTAASLAALRRRGVSRCVVRAAEAPATPAQLAQRVQRLEHVFRHCADAGGSRLLLQLLRDYRSQEPS
jgi:hypothetical protein